MPTVYKVRCIGYTSDTAGPASGMLSRDNNFIFSNASSARRWLERNASSYTTTEGPTPVEVTSSQFNEILRSNYHERGNTVDDYA